MRKLFLSLAFVLAALSASAQKPVMYAGFFNWNSNNLDVEYAMRVRSSIMDGFTATGRFDLLDRNSESAVQNEINRRASEGAMSDSTALVEQIQEIAAQYILTGEITQCETIPPKGDSQYYTGNVSFSLKVTETKTKKLVAATEIYIKDLKAGMGSSPEEAITDALKMVKNQIKDFVDANFKLKAVVIGDEFEAKGKKLTACYVTLGSDHGISKGQKLNVFVSNMIAGRETKKQIGTVAVEEVMAGDLSKCKVTDGAEVLLTALMEYNEIKDSKPEKAKELQVETAEKSAAGKFFRDMGSSLLK